MHEQAAPWIAAPFIRIVIPYGLGIMAHDFLPGGWIDPLVIFASVGLVSLWIIPPKYFGLLLNCQLLLCGLLFTRLNDQRTAPDWFGHHLDNALALVAEPESLPALGSKSARFTMEIRAVISGEGFIHPHRGKFLLYLPLKEADSLQPGRKYLMRTDPLKLLQSSGNPGSFDFAAYNSRKNIFHQCYVSSTQLHALPESADNIFRRWLTSAQRLALEAMDRSIPAPHQQMAKALLIGYREEVDREVLSAYTDTGVVHVIAVSGMHLGLIFFLLQRILIFPEARFPASRWIKFLLVVGFTWFFSAVAGSAGSIIRAASMFSFLLFAKIIRKASDPLQSISLTAFVLLLWDPNWLWDAGFILSFCALLSIILYQPRIQPLFAAKNPLMKWLGELVSVTLAAQILTTPISIVLFHQTPVYFLPANLIAVPLSSLALIGTLIIWIGYAAGFEFHLAGKITYWLIDWMNRGVEHISNLPGAVISGYNWNWAQAVLAYLLIIVVSAWLNRKTTKGFLLVLVTLWVWETTDKWKGWQHRQQQFLLVYHLPGKSAIGWIDGKSCNYLLNPFTPSGHPALESAHRYLSINESNYFSAPIIQINGRLIWMPSNNRELSLGLGNLMLQGSAPILILTKGVTNISPLLNSPPAVQQADPPGLVIIDGSVPEYRARKWANQLRERHQPVHSTWEKGALQLPVSVGKQPMNRQEPEK